MCVRRPLLDVEALKPRTEKECPWFYLNTLQTQSPNGSFPWRFPTHESIKNFPANAMCLISKRDLQYLAIALPCWVHEASVIPCPISRFESLVPQTRPPYVKLDQFASTVSEPGSLGSEFSPNLLSDDPNATSLLGGEFRGVV